MRSHRFWCFMVALVGLAESGCSGRQGPPLAEVEGVVLLDEKPLAQAQVVFQPLGKDSSPSYAQTSENGEFKLEYNVHRKGATIGTHQVQVTTQKIVTDESGNETTIEEKIPVAYNKRSTLKYEIKPEKNKFEIKLSSNVPES